MIVYSGQYNSGQYDSGQYDSGQYDSGQYDSGMDVWYISDVTGQTVSCPGPCD